MSILELNDVSIRYMTGDFKEIGLKEYVIRRLQGKYQVHEFWADRNISFSLEAGDMLGIIGSNGAGKSTLLKAISGIMEPTRGHVRREGSIAALLELGSGFDGDLTVRENTYLRGAMLGYTRGFMDEKYDSIIGFAELQDFQDRPFKQLSSGMKSRLAFSIASLVKPDILILDEVLSVGDGAFRAKSEAKMREIIADGTTTILVSHSLAQVRSLCTKILWLHKGEQVAFGDDVEELCDRYEQFLEGDVRALRTNPLRDISHTPADCSDKGASVSLCGSAVLEDIFAFHENSGGYRLAGARTDGSPLWEETAPRQADSDWFLFDLANVVLRREGEPSPFEMTRPQLEERLGRFVDAVRALYPEERIVMVRTQYLLGYRTATGFPAFSSTKEDIPARELTNICMEIVRDLLQNCPVIPMPGYNYGDPDHPRGCGSLNYDRAYYDYALKALDVIVQPDETGETTVPRLQKAYGAYFKEERRHVRENSLEGLLEKDAAKHGS